MELLEFIADWNLGITLYRANAGSGNANNKKN